MFLPPTLPLLRGCAFPFVGDWSGVGRVARCDESHRLRRTRGRLMAIASDTDTDSERAIPGPVETVRALAPLVAEHADSIEVERRLPEPVVHALIESGVFKLLAPRALG